VMGMIHSMILVSFERNNDISRCKGTYRAKG